MSGDEVSSELRRLRVGSADHGFLHAVVSP